jgi:dipeptidase E
MGMKLYLSSYRAPVASELFALLPKPPEQCKLAIIPNAKDAKLPEERALKLDELTLDLNNLGLASDIVDLRDYDDGQSLFEALKTYDGVWVAGGNTFVLRSEMQRSGFDEIVKQLLDTGFVYCGESAGAIVAGVSLVGAEIADEPELAETKIDTGLDLVANIFVPHADSSDFVEYVNYMKKLYTDDPNVVYLGDKQAYVVSDNYQKIVDAS